jgi:hypothetical protein
MDERRAHQPGRVELRRLDVEQREHASYLRATKTKTTEGEASLLDGARRWLDRLCPLASRDALCPLASRRPLCPLASDVRGAVHLARCVTIVTRAEQAHVLHGRGPSEPVRDSVLERQEASCTAASPLGVDECATCSITFPHDPRDLHRHMPRAELQFAPLARLTCARASMHLAGDQRVERSLEQRR